MNHENNIYAIHQIASLLGINVSSIERWVASGKLKCIETKDGTVHCTIEHLQEFAKKYNISMKFLKEPVQHNQLKTEKIFRSMSAAQ